MLVLVSISVTLGLAPLAHAQVGYVVRGTQYGEDVLIGMVDITNDGVLNREAAICYRGLLAPTWRLIDAGTSAGLNGQYFIHGDQFDTGGNGDGLYMVPYDGYNPAAGYCLNGGGAVYSSWNRLLFNGWQVTLYGDEGNDILDSGWSAATIAMSGGGGNDTLLNRGTAAYAGGDTGDDTVWSTSSGGSDTSHGGAGVDCVYDSSGTFFQFKCGTETDTWYTTGTPSDASCEGSANCSVCGICP